ncbi:alpha/beta hydrolase [Actinoplanes lobatus]|uniref:Alpha/beta hydrolase n=1 Tax=Actinoplanes lobatus TaxID=113568 RepID=A0A7W7MKW5_9ACTN|nr:alpha/beta hydrolase [Actinoplanes lobatus]MBB4753525.1 pimeloyl-ACP methyl ester carboxylesterase [Actinoplanes lobatus]GGN91656.1 alpha/beta hydrolase [Actinoplanes lobatus]GIE38059.1 alpha/beta hydrolase [Actinoplanes lobatus]
MTAEARERIITLAGGRQVPVLEGGDLGGRPVLFHHGTPSSRHQATPLSDAARDHGIRLISFNRPGYGRTPNTSPSLASVGADAIAIADALEVARFGTVGLSGGGPYALATALAAPERVTAVAVVGGIGPWRLALPHDPDDHERDLLALADAGDLNAALAGFRSDLAPDVALLDIADDDAMVAAYFDGIPATELTWLTPEVRRCWAVDMREALSNADGYARDNLAWGGPWDIDVTAVRCPVHLYYGDRDSLVPEANGRWLAARLPNPTFVTFPNAGHGTTTFGHWDTVFAALPVLP